MKKRIDWKKGVFTVEAAVIVPMIAVITAILIGYCYYVHQINWYKGAAYEAVSAGMKDLASAEETARERIGSRAGEIPINTGETKTDVASAVKLSVSFDGVVLSKVFGDLYSYEGEASMMKFDPVKVKMLEFFLERIVE